MATSAGSPQIAVRTHGSKTCSKHYGKDVVYYCKNCNNLSCAECVIQGCQGHVLEGLNYIIPTAKQQLQDFINRLEVTEIPRIKGQSKELDKIISNTRKDFKEKINSIKQQNEDLKKELDKIEKRWVKTCQDMEKLNLDELYNQNKVLQDRIDELYCQLNEFKRTLDSGHDVLVFDTFRKIPSQFEDISLSVSNPVKFEPWKIQLYKLEQLFGELNINPQSNAQSQSKQTINLDLSRDLKVVSEFTPLTEHGVKSMHQTAGGQTWLSFYNNNKKKKSEKLLLTDLSGQIKQSLDMPVHVTDFCVSIHTGNIWFCSVADNSVREVDGGKSTIKFVTDDFPRSIMVTTDDHVIIGHPLQLVKYTQTGQIVCKTSDSTPMVRSPRCISICPLTSNLAVVNWALKSEGGDGKRFVSIFNDQLQPLHTYTGEEHGQQRGIFDPQDICYTNKGEIIVTEWNKRIVLLITGTGNYLKILYTNLKTSAVALCISNDALWLSFANGTVQVLQNI